MLHQRLVRNGYDPGELSAVSNQPAAAVLAALESARSGDLYDLDAGRWSGMAVLPGHAPFTMTTFRTPKGHDLTLSEEDRRALPADRTGVITELMVGTAHTGTHVDALCHISIGDELFGGRPAAEHLSDAGASWADAASLEPIVCRGIVIDAAGYLGAEALPAGYRITTDDVRGALKRQGLEVQPGDAVLVRTGYMSVWQSPRAADHYGAGLGLDAACWLADAGACLLAADTEDFEPVPGRDGEPLLPVHRELLVRRGIPIGELFYLEQLAQRSDSTFLFVCSPLRIVGATGSMVRPLAIL